MSYDDGDDTRRMFFFCREIPKKRKEVTCQSNGYPGMTEFAEDDVTTTFIQHDSKGTNLEKLDKNTLPQIVYGNYKHGQTSLQVKLYNFLERPTGWKCFIYHFTV
ncbi:hypothetical protein ACJMK2_030293 [Sinanodonta woodiana]|uniref:Uncharacterized protein n=1 Tax=Sinanodonta woodiana TaxID=1069815 RepID=A0ABD3XEM4_SINWO